MEVNLAICALCSGSVASHALLTVEVPCQCMYRTVERAKASGRAPGAALLEVSAGPSRLELTGLIPWTA